MGAEAQYYIPYFLRLFQGFSVKDLKEFIKSSHMEIHLERLPDEKRLCHICGTELGEYHDRYRVQARHLKVFNWSVNVCFWREKRHCPRCRKVRSELIDFICPTSPHMTMELAWWVNRLTELTSVLQVSKLEGLDKMSCYQVDKFILSRLLQGYEIPKVTRISVDEVYARGPKQQKEGETRDDLFLTIIVDLRTHKVIWVSQSRRKEALDLFFKILGPKKCQEIEVVATDQHAAYAQSVREFCPNASVVWDRFHLVQKFNEALNTERQEELENIDPEGQMGDLMNGKYRYVFLTKAKNRKQRDERHINEVTRLNERMAQLEMIKERFHQIFDCPTALLAQEVLCECYDWACQIKATWIMKWIWSVMDAESFWNYFKFRVTTGLSEGINRAIKGLKWQAYGYKDMKYFALKIMQKVGYLNSNYILHLYSN